MDYMKKEMQEEFMQNVQKGKIWGLRLVKTPISPESEAYKKIFGKNRKITDFDSKCFYVDGCEAYYEAFDYFDEEILRSVVSIPMALDQSQCIAVTEYEILWSY